jgi:guanyl-specific ribonuclease Sa
MRIAADKLVAELKKQVQQESQEPSKPLSDEEMRKALEKRMFEFRRDHAFNGDVKPGDTMLVCGGDGAGGMSCITSTYLDRLVAWYVGLDEIEKCFKNFSASCMRDLALHALKTRIAKRTKVCRKGFAVQRSVVFADERRGTTQVAALQAQSSSPCDPPWITPGSLPAAEESALNDTLSHIDAGTVPSGSTARRWGVQFKNWGGDLPGPSGPSSPYREYRVAPPPGVGGAGPLRVVRNTQTGEVYYTWTHYGDSGPPAFVRIR